MSRSAWSVWSVTRVHFVRFANRLSASLAGLEFTMAGQGRGTSIQICVGQGFTRLILGTSRVFSIRQVREARLKEAAHSAISAMTMCFMKRQKRRQFKRTRTNSSWKVFKFILGFLANMESAYFHRHLPLSHMINLAAIRQGSCRPSIR